MSLKIGDRVQFKDFIDQNSDFLGEMYYLCGTYATVKSIQNNKLILDNFTFKDDDNYKWHYTVDMVVKVDNPLTEEDIKVLSYIDEKYSYLARDKSGILQVFRKHPDKYGDYFSDGYADAMINHFKPTLFENVTFENSPIKFRAQKFTFTKREEFLLKLLSYEYKELTRDIEGNIVLTDFSGVSTCNDVLNNDFKIITHGDIITIKDYL